MITYLLQSTSRNDEIINAEVNALNSIGSKWLEFGIPFTPHITNLENILVEPKTKFIARCATNFIHSLKNMTNLNDHSDTLKGSQLAFNSFWIDKLKASVFYDEEKFDQRVHSLLDLPMLNHDAFFVQLKDCLSGNVVFPEDKFIKPSSDLKAFTAGVLKSCEPIDVYLAQQTHGVISQEEWVLIAPVKSIKKEYRFFVMGNQVITGSETASHGKVKWKALTQDSDHVDAQAAAKEYATLYAPNDMIFTMDICETSDHEYKIVEYNCFNCSGLYASDHAKVFSSLNEALT